MENMENNYTGARGLDREKDSNKDIIQAFNSVDWSQPDQVEDNIRKQAASFIKEQGVNSRSIIKKMLIEFHSDNSESSSFSKEELEAISRVLISMLENNSSNEDANHSSDYSETENKTESGKRNEKEGENFSKMMNHQLPDHIKESGHLNIYEIKAYYEEALRRVKDDPIYESNMKGRSWESMNEEKIGALADNGMWINHESFSQNNNRLFTNPAIWTNLNEDKIDSSVAPLYLDDNTKCAQVYNLSSEDRTKILISIYNKDGTTDFAIVDDEKMFAPTENGDLTFAVKRKHESVEGMKSNLKHNSPDDLKIGITKDKRIVKLSKDLGNNSYADHLIKLEEGDEFVDFRWAKESVGDFDPSSFFKELRKHGFSESTKRDILFWSCKDNWGMTFLSSDPKKPGIVRMDRKNGIIIEDVDIKQRKD